MFTVDYVKPGDEEREKITYERFCTREKAERRARYLTREKYADAFFMAYVYRTFGASGQKTYCSRYPATTEGEYPQ